MTEIPAWKGLIAFALASASCLALAVALDRACLAPPAAAAPPVILDVVRPARGIPDRSHEVCEAAPETHAPPRRLGVLLLDPVTDAERALVVRAIDGCQQTTRAVADPWLVLALARIEADAGAPPGMLLAAWCREASMRTVGARTGGPILGDWLDGVARAVGPYQLHAWFRAWCGGGPEQAADLIWSAECYLSRVLDTLPLTAECPNPWRVAEAWTANSPKYIPRGCAAKSQHWEILESWGPAR